MKYKIELYDPDHVHKSTETHISEVSAIRSGQNWVLLSPGNSYVLLNENSTIEEVKPK
jgi:hypothetical protein